VERKRKSVLTEKNTLCPISTHNYYVSIKRTLLARCWWLTPVITATWETEIRRIEVRGQTRQIVHKLPK
jgi:hypothetical protein